MPNQDKAFRSTFSRYPDDAFDPPPENDPLPEELELELELGEVDSVPDELDDPSPDPVEPEPPMYGQGLQSRYEKPHVCPRRHVQARPLTGSRGQLSIPVQVRPEELDPDPDPDPEAGVCRNSAYLVLEQNLKSTARVSHLQSSSYRTT